MSHMGDDREGIEKQNKKLPTHYNDQKFKNRRTYSENFRRFFISLINQPVIFKFQSNEKRACPAMCRASSLFIIHA
ncbi:hypothetical protein [Halobacillus sp. H74]|uniref:hypothetical protein n=1 Tax=Halobacillus sp. H74 TaxID=3457436 RepID=UPI003FCDBE91